MKIASQAHFNFGIEPQPRRNTQGGKWRYKDPKNRAYQDAISMLARTQYKDKPLEGAVRADLTFFLPIPQSASKKRRKELIGSFHAKRPDKDNLEKLIFDALNGIAYKDDGQIAWTVSKKFYSIHPHIEVTISKI